jgi:hypothetical protein
MNANEKCLKTLTPGGQPQTTFLIPFATILLLISLSPVWLLSKLDNYESFFLASRCQFHKTFFSIIYAPSGATLVKTRQYTDSGVNYAKNVL